MKRWLLNFFYNLIIPVLPNVLTENPENGKAHLIFELKTPIYTTDASYPKPIIYANAIIKRLQQLFNADVGYSGLITKILYQANGEHIRYVLSLTHWMNLRIS